MGTGAVGNNKDALENFTGANKMISNDHAYIHSGIFYSATDKQTIATTANYAYEITTPSSTASVPIYIHYRQGAISSSADKVTVELYEGATLSGGSAMTMKNHNRNSALTSDATVKKGVTISAAGTLIDSSFIGGGTGVGGRNSGDGLGDAEEEWVLKPNTTYLLKITNDSSGNNIVHTRIKYYEETAGE